MVGEILTGEATRLGGCSANGGGNKAGRVQ